MADQEERFIVAIAYQPGKDPRIRKGLDGRRDFLTAAEVRKAAHAFMRNGPKGGTFHVDGTVGAIKYAESWIQPNDWHVTLPDGTATVVKAGTWCVAGYLDEPAWDLYKRGLINGVSPQGVARLAKRRSSG